MADLSPHILLPWTILIYVCIEKFFSAINLEKESLYLVETFPLPEPDLVYNELNNWAHKLKKVTLKYIQYICFLKLFPFCQANPFYCISNFAFLAVQNFSILLLTYNRRRRGKKTIFCDK